MAFCAGGSFSLFSQAVTVAPRRVVGKWERAIGDKLADGAVEVEDGFRCWRVIADTLAKFCHLLAKL